MSLSWEESYLGQLRALAGQRVLIMVSARCVVRDEQGRVLLMCRSDNGHWALPGGAMEVGESIVECAIRELFEETGLRANAVTPFALYSGPLHTFVNAFGDTYQLHTTAFRVDAFTGTLLTTTEESTDAGFFDVSVLPEPLVSTVRPTLEDLDRFESTGRFVLG